MKTEHPAPRDALGLPGGLVVVLVMGSAAAGRAARVVLFAFVVVNALRVIAVVCVDGLQGTASFPTPFRSVSESSALESYGIFRDCAQLLRGGGRKTRKNRSGRAPIRVGST